MATVTFTVPSNIFALSSQIEKAAMQAVNFTVDAVATDFQSSVTHFVHKPTFNKEKAALRGGSVVGSVWTNDENYVRLNNGTTAHVVGGAGQLMRFHGVRRRNYRKGIMVYQPKSIAGSLPSRPGGDLTAYTVVARGPWHVRGIDARNYDLIVAQKNDPVLAAAFNRFLKIK